MIYFVFSISTTQCIADLLHLKFEASWYSKLKKTPDDDQQVNEQHRDINMTDFEDMFLWIGLKKHDFAFKV